MYKDLAFLPWTHLELKKPKAQARNRNNKEYTTFFFFAFLLIVGTMLQTHAKMKDLFADAKDSQEGMLITV